MGFGRDDSGGFRDTDDLWAAVERVKHGLREGGSAAAAERLQVAMTVSGHPGEVCPKTLAVLQDLLRDQPRGLDGQLATAYVEALSRWP
jgi:hypothetical protein